MAIDIFKTVNEASQALKNIREADKFKVTTGNKSRFEESAFYDKLKNDVLFLEALYNELVGDEKLKDAFDAVVTEAAICAHELLKEADLSPKIITPLVEFSSEPLSEEEVVKAYKRAFNLILENEFNKPNLEGQLLTEDIIGPDNCEVTKISAPGATGILMKCVKKGILADTDPEAAVKYAHAENTMINALKELFLPRGTYDAAVNYGENQDKGYKEVFGDTYQQNLDKFNQRCSLLGSFLAPFLFKKALEDAGADVKFNPTSVAGLVGGVSADTNTDVNVDEN